MVITTDAERTGAAPDESEETVVERSALPKDELFHLLQNERRRRALQYLWEYNEEVIDISDMAEHIAALENDVEVAQVTAAQRKRVYVGLYQCHLSKLDEAGLIEYDKDRGTIAQTPLTAQVAPYLAVEAEAAPNRITTAHYALAEPGPVVAATVVAVALTVGAWTSTLPSMGLWLPTVLTGLFAGATLVSVLK